MADADVTLQEAADLLGVHYMTAYRYVRLGVLPATKAGGTWHVRRADIDELRAGGPSQPGKRRRAPWAERLEARLVAGDGRGAWGVVEAALAAGTEVDEVYLDVIAPALSSIGNRWEAGELDVATEHRASGIAMRIIGRLGPRFVRRGRSRGVVVLGTPEGERHGLPVAMVADIVRGAGWEVSDLGTDLPARDFARAAVSEGPSLVAVGVSVTTPSCLAATEALLVELRRALPHVALVVGGGAVRDASHAAELGADGFAVDGRGMVELVEAVSRGELGPRASDEQAG